MKTDEPGKNSVLFGTEDPAAAYLLANMLEIMRHCVMLQNDFGFIKPQRTDSHAAAEGDFFTGGKAVLPARRINGEIGITKLNRFNGEFAVPDTAIDLLIGEIERVKTRFGIRAPEHEVAAFVLQKYCFFICEAEPFDISANESLLHIDGKHSAPPQNAERIVVIKFFQSFFLKIFPAILQARGRTLRLLR